VDISSSLPSLSVNPPFLPFGFLFVAGRLSRLAGLEALGDPKTYQGSTDDEDDGEDNDDTSLLLGPVLTLGDGAEGVACDNGSVDGRDFE
jgi:hypothetical protein